MRRGRITVFLAIGWAFTAAHCAKLPTDGPSPDAVDMSDAELTDTALPDDVRRPDLADPCGHVTAPCAAPGARCDGDVVASCVEDVKGCLVQTRFDCTLSGAECVNDGTGPVCVDTDPCSEVPNRCSVVGRRCLGHRLVVCKPRADGCLVETVMECISDATNVCDAAHSPVACGFDQCHDVPGSCADATLAVCADATLVRCAEDAFGCLVVREDDCALTPGASCETQGSGAACFGGPTCAGCTGAPSCDGNTLVRCVPDAFGCPTETRVDCAAARASGYCDTTGGSATCAIDRADRCAGKDLCPGSDEARFCADDGSGALIDCAFDAVGCLVREKTDCAAATPSQACVGVAGQTKCALPCSDDPGCAGRGEGEAWCVSNALYTCADVNANGCLDLRLQACGDAVCADGPQPACVVQGSGDACSDAILLDKAQLQLVGSSFAGQFTDQQTFGHASCAATAAGGGHAELVVTVDLARGETLTVTEHSVSLDVIISVVESCVDEAVCLASVDYPELEGVTYVAQSAQTVTVVVEAWGAGANAPYDVRIGVRTPVCGDGVIEGVEACDDGNGVGADGCSDTCQVESGWACRAQPSDCHVFGCGDGYRDGIETCDDGNTLPSDGCSPTCELEPTYQCVGEPSRCYTGTGDTCASAILLRQPGTYTFDSTGLAANYTGYTGACSPTGRAADGVDMVFAIDVPAGQVVTVGLDPQAIDSVLLLSSDCVDPRTSCVTFDDAFAAGLREQVQWTNDGAAQQRVFVVADAYLPGAADTFELDFAFRVPTCGDGTLDAGEACDDGVYPPLSGDGCSAGCAIEPSWACAGEPSVCEVMLCGDGNIVGDEACDDGNDVGGDGCSAVCAVEAGMRCVGEPSVCATLQPGDTCANPVVLSGSGTVGGSYSSFFDDYTSSGCFLSQHAGADAVYAIALAAGDELTVTVTPPSWVDAMVYVAGSCGDLATTCLVGADSGLSGVAETVVFKAKVARTVLVFVDAWTAAASGPYTLQVDVR